VNLNQNALCANVGIGAIKTIILGFLIMLFAINAFYIFGYFWQWWLNRGQ
jgi:hypothetical protein